jgi:thiamine biosynthesis protein ThiI
MRKTNKQRALLLLSSGIDSPVAGYLMKKKGLEIIVVHFDNQPFTDNKAREKSIKLARLLNFKKIYIVPFGKFQTENLRNCNRRFQCEICRRMMFRIAEKIAEKEKCKYLITGENLGQVASQTLSNLIVNDKAVKIPILRPLLCNDKIETIEIARKIRTYEISIEPGMCCNLVPKKPVTRCKLDIIEKEESKLNIEKIIKDTIKDVGIFYN